MKIGVLKDVSKKIEDTVPEGWYSLFEIQKLCHQRPTQIHYYIMTKKLKFKYRKDKNKSSPTTLYYFPGKGGGNVPSDYN